MAIDEVLLKSLEETPSRPVFRIYGWSPPALSLGRFQRAAEVLDLDLCQTAGVQIVRRITGGGIIYHADEITYSIVCTQENIPSSKSVKDSFRVLTGFLLQFYRNLGLQAAYAIDSAANDELLGQRTDYCFAGKETFDIMINGRKIGGNAQRRTKRIIFQHGSIPLVGREKDGIRFLRKPPTGLEERVTCLADEGVTCDPEFLKDKLKEAFRTNLDALLVDGEWADSYHDDVCRLSSEKYLADEWNLHGEDV